MATTPLVLIDIHTDEGITGRSYVRCYTPIALAPLVGLITNLREALIGAPAAPAVVERKLLREFRLADTQGLAGMALAGFDMALWDARARACGVPLVTPLGGEPGPVAAYASLRSMDPCAAAEEARERLGQGFAAIKVKLGRGDLDADLETIRTLRKAFGDGVRLMVDYNQGLTVDEAIARAHVLDDEGTDFRTAGRRHRMG